MESEHGRNICEPTANGGQHLKSHFLSPLLEAGRGQFLLRNERTKEVLATHVEAAVDSASRRKGLLGRTELPVGEALIIAPCSAIHTFFMKFTIDVAFVSRDGMVIRACHRVRPWRMAVGIWALAAIELREGALHQTMTQRGDKLILEPRT